MPDLFWLPSLPDSAAAINAAGDAAPDWSRLAELSRTKLDFSATRSLARLLSRQFPVPPVACAAAPVTLAVLSSSTSDHLVPAIRVGALRRNQWLDVLVPAYGQYRQALLDPSTVFGSTRPDAVLFSLDARHMLARMMEVRSVGEAERQLDEVIEDLAAQWGRAKSLSCGQVIQQTLLPVFTPLLGENEQRLPGALAWAVTRFNALLRARADADGVDVLSVDWWVSQHGLGAWHDPALWHRAKQEIHPNAAPFYGDLVARLLAAAGGRSFKALVLDLDNTLWGGVIGDDGMTGITLGQGSAAGEAFAGFQRHVRNLGRRGIILGVCSKNDEATALEPFTSHSDMVLRRDDIACFVANWTDKATNLRAMAETLRIGLDSIVFVDDNPAERAIVRRELPAVAVPEMPQDVTLYPLALAAAGYFEACRITDEDLDRGSLYQANIARTRLVDSSTDLDGYLCSLKMRALWSRFARTDKSRLVQLINKTNQFNLTTQRMTEPQITALIDDPEALTLQVRLIDQFGDNGLIAVVIGLREPGTRDIVLQSWLMSCRVLGRGVEQLTLNLIVAQAQAQDAHRLIGLYRATPKNALVRHHYINLGFRPMDDTQTRFVLDLDNWEPRSTFIDVEPPLDSFMAA